MNKISNAHKAIITIIAILGVGIIGLACFNYYTKQKNLKMLYNEAITAYNNKDYEQALNYFKEFEEPYQDTQKYLAELNEYEDIYEKAINAFTADTMDESLKLLETLPENYKERQYLENKNIQTLVNTKWQNKEGRNGGEYLEAQFVMEYNYGHVELHKLEDKYIQRRYQESYDEVIEMHELIKKENVTVTGDAREDYTLDISDLERLNRYYCKFGITNYLYKPWNPTYSQSSKSPLERKKNPPVGDLEFTSKSWHKDGEYCYAQGTIYNGSDEVRRYVKIRVTYLDTYGEVLTTDWNYAVGDEGIYPGESQQFEIMTKVRGVPTKARISVMEYM